ncbi:hypothetical protein D9O50_00930 [Oxalobacteraceae bacterium CAVE-383]|nr:hypothetical protein D9O50_00930 [Oxalobacteraceae bacterium CAVE-383]
MQSRGKWGDGIFLWDRPVTANLQVQVPWRDVWMHEVTPSLIMRQRRIFVIYLHLKCLIDWRFIRKGKTSLTCISLKMHLYYQTHMIPMQIQLSLWKNC